jgi:hypothetical protein
LGLEEWLPSKHNILSSNSSTDKKKKKDIKEICCKELAYAIVEAEKSYDLLSASYRPGKADSVVQVQDLRI